MTVSIYEQAGLFLIYAFLGWCVEVCYAAVTTGKVVNRGFLNGPVCPIYGVGMVGVILLLVPLSDRPPVLFLGGMIFCTLVELIGGWLLKKIFDTRWWDYSDKPFNLGGYICLSFSILWGLAVTFAVRLVHPTLLGLVRAIPHTLGLVLLIVLYVLLAADLIMTLVTIIGIKRQMKELERVAGALHAVSDTISDHLGATAIAADARMDELRETGQEKVARQKEKVTAAVAASREKAEESRHRLEDRMTELQARKEQLEARREHLAEELRSRFGVRRLTAAFPDIRGAIQAHLDNLDKE